MLAASVMAGLLCAASSYRLSLRLLEKRLSPSAAALAAVALYGAASAGTGMLAVRRIREAPLPVPSQTAREATEALASATPSSSGA